MSAAKCILAALLLVGCAPPSVGDLALPVDPNYRAVSAVVDAWDADPELRPLSAECRSVLERARIVYQSAAQFRRSGWCPRLADGTCGECAACKAEYIATGSRRRPSLTIYLAPGGTSPHVVVEAVTRAAAKCAGYGPEDYWWGRKDPALWGPDGVRARAVGAL